jgi:D-tyrosyl-tRNA(Tyr) deacylase
VRAVVQRVRHARVEADGRVEGSIASGLLVYLGVGRGDTEAALRYLSEKIVNLRIFPDADGKMNLSLRELRSDLRAAPQPQAEHTDGESRIPGILVVSQFTLYADVRKGRRPSFNDAAPPEEARRLYDAFLASLAAIDVPPQSGLFREHMEVTYTNDGPVTILIDTDRDG